MVKVVNYFRNRYLRLLSPYYFISFPKSGRTWVKSFLVNYYSCHFDIPLFYDFAPIWRSGVYNNIPRIMFSHARHRGDSEEDIVSFIRTLRCKKIIFLVRDPKRIVFTYYFRLVKRMEDQEASSMSLPEFIRHPSLGITEIVRFMNTWYSYHKEFREFQLLRYEDCLVDPRSQFQEMLEYLSAPIDAASVECALGRSVDTTRKIEEGGLVRDQGLVDDIRRGSQYFESTDGSKGSIKRYHGDEAVFFSSFTPADLDYMRNELQKLAPVFGYH